MGVLISAGPSYRKLTCVRSPTLCSSIIRSEEKNQNQCKWRTSVRSQCCCFLMLKDYKEKSLLLCFCIVWYWQKKRPQKNPQHPTFSVCLLDRGLTESKNLWEQVHACTQNTTIRWQRRMQQPQRPHAVMVRGVTRTLWALNSWTDLPVWKKTSITLQDMHIFCSVTSQHGMGRGGEGGGGEGGHRLDGWKSTWKGLLKLSKGWKQRFQKHDNNFRGKDALQNRNKRTNMKCSYGARIEVILGSFFASRGHHVRALKTFVDPFLWCHNYPRWGWLQNTV